MVNRPQKYNNLPKYKSKNSQFAQVLPTYGPQYHYQQVSMAQYYSDKTMYFSQFHIISIGN